MTPENWHKVKEVFEAALGHAPEERSAFLGQACGDDDLLCSEVKSLLSSYEQEKSFMETPAAALAAQSLIKEESAALVGQQLGHYQIIREIGRGGMGVVYLAQDVSLGRPVALKLLPKHLTSDPNRLRRFEREARAASALNHHNILTIYEIANLDGLHSIATEFIDGVTLRERIKSKDLELSETLNIAEQIASALVAAHEAGIVHRDIKPENVMIRRDGYVKVLDFGLAKLTEQQTIKPVCASTSIAGTNTDTGVMGTVGYMSPEQARGESVDHRTDIFSLAVVIYEMLSGKMPFQAKTAADVNVPIPDQEPLPLAHYLPEAPAELQLIVNKALRRNKEERYQTIAEFLIDLRRVRSGRTSTNNITRRLVLFAATFTLIVGGLLWFYASRQTVKSSLPPMKVIPFTSFQGPEFAPAFSPDGNQITFMWWNGEKGGNFNFDIYVKQIGGERALQLTSDPAWEVSPVWSPDGQKIAFGRISESEVAIFTISSLGGAERKLLSLGLWTKWDKLSLSWSPDGKLIAYSGKASALQPSQIFLLEPDSLEKRILTSPPGQSGGDILPHFSPDGKTLAFERIDNDGVLADIYLQPVTGGEPRQLTFDNINPVGFDWTADGREIVYSSNRAGPASLWKISASGGTPAERLTVGGDNAVYPSVSRHGHRLAYAHGSADLNIYRIEISGSTGRPSSPAKFISSTQSDRGSQFSQDGKRIAFESTRSGNDEIWVSDSDGSNQAQLTFNGAWAGTPRWSPDGRQIAFDSKRETDWDIYTISLDGGLPHRVTTEPSDENVPSWSRDGRWIYFSSDRTGKQQVWKAPAEGGEPVQVTKDGGFLAFESSDGKYVYYTKDRDVQLTPGIWRTPVEGGDETVVLDSFNAANWGDWAVVEDGIYFIDCDAKRACAIQFFDFPTRRVTQLASLGQDVIFLNGLAVSPDRRQILYTREDDTGGVDIWLVENFR